jgi:hypothetical protein
MADDDREPLLPSIVIQRNNEWAHDSSTVSAASLGPGSGETAFTSRRREHHGCTCLREPRTIAGASGDVRCTIHLLDGHGEDAPSSSAGVVSSLFTESDD